MTDLIYERLYRLLPSIYRQRDQQQGYALRTLMDALESEFELLEADLDALYDNWFIETADEWAVPYIGDLLAIYDFSDRKNQFFSQRRRVANTIGYRRRKGLPSVLEHVAQDVTGWFACAFEYRQLLATTQHLSHLSATRGGFVDLRDLTSLAALDGPFETSAHTVDIRHIGTSSQPGAINPPRNVLPGKYRPASLGLFVWRLSSYQMSNIPAFPMTRDARGRRLPSGCFTFEPQGHDFQLFILPQEVTTITRRVDASNVPGPISRAAFASDLKEYAALGQQRVNSIYYGPQRSLSVILNGKPVPTSAVIAADLSNWRLPYPIARQSNFQVAIDVELGRLLVLHPARSQKSAPDSVEGTFCYGFSTELGGGPYLRRLPPPEEYIISVKRGYDTAFDVEKGSTTSTLKGALNLWDQYCSTTSKPRGTIRILDNGTYDERGLAITLPNNCRLVIEATHSLRPTISPAGGLNVVSKGDHTQLSLNGLLINQQIRLSGSLLLEVTHCTLMPHGIEVQRTPDATSQIMINYSISGPLLFTHGKGSLTIQDSIIDGLNTTAISTFTQTEDAGVVLQLERATVFGAVQVQTLALAREVIFTTPIIVRQRHSGLVSCSYVPRSSQTPRRDRCQPDLALAQQRTNPSALPNHNQSLSLEQLLTPLFTSSHYGDPGYAQLSTRCPPQILRGAEDGSEMGAFHDLRTVQRQDNLYHILDEYFPFELDVNIFFLT